MFNKTSFFLLVIIGALAFESIAAPPQKILGGKRTRVSELPYQVSLRRKGSHVCGGAIISRYHILTAAHCTGGRSVKSLSVYTGSILRSSGGQSYKVLRASRHHQFIDDDISYLKHDVAVITLAEPITFNEYQKPVKLASRVYEAGTSAVVAGWGDIVYGQDEGSETLLKIRMKLENISECELLENADKLRNIHVCTRSNITAIKRKGFCHGDSGGPLVVGAGEEREVVGIVSYTFLCGYFTDMYTNVFSYKKFIEKEMKFIPKKIEKEEMKK